MTKSACIRVCVWINGNLQHVHVWVTLLVVCRVDENLIENLPAKVFTTLAAPPGICTGQRTTLGLRHLP